MDLFEAYEQQPKELQSILSKYDLDALSYEDCKQMLKEVEAIGFTFDYGLDAQPYDLREIQLPNGTQAQTVKTIKTFKTIEELTAYAIKIGYGKDSKKIEAEVNKKALIKYGSILILFDPYGLID